MAWAVRAVPFKWEEGREQAVCVSKASCRKPHHSGGVREHAPEVDLIQLATQVDPELLEVDLVILTAPHRSEVSNAAPFGGGEHVEPSPFAKRRDRTSPSSSRRRRGRCPSTHRRREQSRGANPPPSAVASKGSKGLANAGPNPEIYLVNPNRCEDLTPTTRHSKHRRRGRAVARSLTVDRRPRAREKGGASGALALLMSNSAKSRLGRGGSVGPKRMGGTVSKAYPDTVTAALRQTVA